MTVTSFRAQQGYLESMETLSPAPHRRAIPIPTSRPLVGASFTSSLTKVSASTCCSGLNSSLFTRAVWSGVGRAVWMEASCQGPWQKPYLGSLQWSSGSQTAALGKPDLWLARVQG